MHLFDRSWVVGLKQPTRLGHLHMRTTLHAEQLCGKFQRVLRDHFFAQLLSRGIGRQDNRHFILLGWLDDLLGRVAQGHRLDQQFSVQLNFFLGLLLHRGIKP